MAATKGDPTKTGVTTRVFVTQWQAAPPLRASATRFFTNKRPGAGDSSSGVPEIPAAPTLLSKTRPRYLPSQCHLTLCDSFAVSFETYPFHIPTVASTLTFSGHLPQEVIEREAALGAGGGGTARVREFYHHEHTGAEPMGFLSSSRRNVVVKSREIARQSPRTPRLKDSLTSLPPPLPSLSPAFGTEEKSQRKVPGGGNELVNGGRWQRGALVKGRLGFRPVGFK